MPTTWQPRSDMPRYCANCYALQALHSMATGACPERYRPDTLAEAMRELAAAQAAGQQGRIFAARGEVQRLAGHRIVDCPGGTEGQSLCAGCTVLAVTA